MNKSLLVLLTVAVPLILGFLYFYKDDSVAATVNGSPVSRNSIVEELERKSGKQLLDTKINYTLIDQEAKNKGITIDESELAGEINVVNSQMTSMGSNLQEQLLQQGMTEQDLKDQLTRHLRIEKLLADKLQVTQEEINTYITKNKVTIAPGKETETRAQIEQQIKEDKVNELTGPYLAELRAKAKIEYYVNY